MKNKTKSDYILIFKKLKEHISICKEFAKIVFNKIKSKSDNDDFNKFLKYFEDTYLIMLWKLIIVK